MPVSERFSQVLQNLSVFAVRKKVVETCVSRMLY
jgi:hypothetical protein